MRLALLASFLFVSSAASADYLLIHPFPGSKAGERDSANSFELPEGPVQGGKLTKSTHLKGRVARRTFKNPKGHKAAEIYQWYENQLQSSGFKKLWTCQGKDCGSGKGPKLLFAAGPIGAEDRLLTARFPRRELGDVYVAIHVTPADAVLVTAQTTATPEVKAKAAEEAAAVAKDVTAGRLEDALSKDGYASLSGILYKPGEVALRPEAQPIVKEIAKLLKDKPDIELYVVGHTDDVGSIAQNVALSKKRAQWLVAQLRKLGVAPARMRPDGVGPLAPVASNRTEDGRAKNRRVELVAR